MDEHNPDEIVDFKVWLDSLYRETINGPMPEEGAKFFEGYVAATRTIAERAGVLPRV